TYRFDGAGYLDDVVQDIYIIPADGGEAKQLTDDDTQNMGLIWSPDGQEILYNAAFQPESFNVFNYNLRLVNMDGKIRELVRDHAMIRSKGWTPDSKHILFIAPIPGSPIGTKSDLWVMRRHGGEPENRTSELKYHAGGGLQGDAPEDFGMMSTLFTSSDGQKIYFDVQQGGTVQVYEAALIGDVEWKPILDGERTVHLQGKSDEHLFYAANTLDKPSDLFISDLDGKNEVQLTHINADILEEFSLPSVENLLFKGSDGEQVEGWIMKPVEGEAPYPTVLYIHGGPHGAFGHTFSSDFQMLAGAGYAVLIVNHRASTGYGNKFATQIKGDWGNLDYKDLMAGVDYAIEKGYADPDRLGVCGLSGGGNLSCWIVGQTVRFKAAVPENPVTNWVSFYGISDIGPHFSEAELGGKPHEIPEVYARCSPITYAHNCTTPTLLIQGERDYRCPAEQSEQFYAVLKANGCVVEMVRLPNSPHAGAINGPVPTRKAQNEALLDWMNRYVLGVTSNK
ncbi:MAG: S9 family peptidase, partial [Anaerolineaceae bacterium]|nr:S9 family peptidase [Anaerolineaceae bacterium]